MRTLSALALSLAAVAAAPAHATDIGVSINIAQPGVYGRIDIGRFPQPALVYAQPVWVQPVPHRPRPQPVYLWVPPGHQKHWDKHCARYRACGVPVYFVRDEWYHQHVERRDDRRDDRDDRRPHGGREGRDGGGPGHGHGHGPGRGHGKGHDRD